MRRPRPVTLACYVVLGLITVGLLAAPLLGFVNRPALWFGLPSIMVWMGLLVLLITPALAVLEVGRSRQEREAGEHR